MDKNSEHPRLSQYLLVLVKKRVIRMVSKKLTVSFDGGPKSIESQFLSRESVECPKYPKLVY